MRASEQSMRSDNCSLDISSEKIPTAHGLLHLLTEPVLGPLRRVLPAVRLGAVALDLSPFVVIIGARILQGFIC